MNKLETKGQINALATLFAFTYMVSYITRINYGAIISEMETATGISRNLLSMAITGSFVTYGVGQIISGILGDRISPKKLISCGLITTSLMNLLIPVCNGPYQMLAVWCVNGFAQSLMWPPIVKIMTMLLSEEDYKKTSAKVSWGSSLGTIIIYLLSPLTISLLNWRWVFIFSAICGILMFFVWNRYSYKNESEDQLPLMKRNSKGKIGILFGPMMISIMVAITLQGMLRDGVTTWMPTYISETYNLSNIISILTGVVLPVFSIICFQIATRLYIKKLTNPLVCAGVFFASGSISALALFLLTGKNALSSVLFSAVLTGCMHGVNLMLICMIPPFFRKYEAVSTVSGIVNSCTYIGSAISTYGIAVLSKNIGWHYTILVWFLIALFGTVICFLCVRPWKSNFEEYANGIFYGFKSQKNYRS